MSSCLVLSFPKNTSPNLTNRLGVIAGPIDHAKVSVSRQEP
jgi:hypothetical protein